MEGILEILPKALREAIAWTLFHSLWQGLLIAVFLGLVLFSLRKAISLKRYLFSITALLLFFGGSLFTFTRYYQAVDEGRNETLVATALFLQNEAPASSIASEMQISFLNTLSELYNIHADLIFGFWFMGISLFSLRFFGGIIYTQRLKSIAIESPPASLMKKFEQLKQRLHIRKQVKLLQSGWVRVPMLAGYLRPVILLPVSLVSHIPASQLEAILLHELIHLKRHDNMINILLRIMEILFFFNPAVWWISGIIRREREGACDEKALEFYQDKISYAQALASIEEFRQNIPVYAAAFSGNKNNLLNRIKRLTMKKQRNNNYLSGLLAVTLVFGSLLVFTASGKISSSSSEDVFYENVTEAGLVKAEPSEAIQKNLLQPDTLKEKKKTRSIAGEVDEKMLVVKSEDGKIVKMIVEGEEINEADYKKHMPQVEKLEEKAREKDKQLEEQLQVQKKLMQEMEEDLALREEELRKIEAKVRERMEKFNQEEMNKKMRAWHQEHAAQIEAMRENIEKQQILQTKKFRELIEQQQQKLREVYGDSLFSNDYPLCFEGIELPEMPAMPELPEMAELHRDLREYYDSDEWLSLQKEIRKSTPSIPSEVYADQSRAYGHLFFGDHFIKSRFKEELLEDGLIDRNERTTIELSDNKFYIDGEKQSRKYAKKYSKLFEAISGKSPGEKTVFDFH